MKFWIGIESSDGTVYEALAADSEGAYRAIGRAMGMFDDEGDIDTGNVDVDLYELKSLFEDQAIKVEPYTED